MSPADQAERVARAQVALHHVDVARGAGQVDVAAALDGRAMRRNLAIEKIPARHLAQQRTHFSQNSADKPESRMPTKTATTSFISTPTFRLKDNAPGFRNSKL